MQHHFTTRCLTYAVFLLCLDVKARGGLRFKRLGGRVDSRAFTQTISEQCAAEKKTCRCLGFYLRQHMFCKSDV